MAKRWAPFTLCHLTSHFPLQHVKLEELKYLIFDVSSWYIILDIPSSRVVWGHWWKLRSDMVFIIFANFLGGWTHGEIYIYMYIHDITRLYLHMLMCIYIYIYKIIIIYYIMYDITYHTIYVCFIIVTTKSFTIHFARSNFPGSNH